MKNKNTKIVLAGLTVISAWGAWFSLSQESSTILTEWVSSLIWFSIFFVFISLFLVVSPNKKWTALVLFFSFFLSFLFAASLWHLALIILGFSAAWSGAFLIEKDLELSLKINLIKSFKLGKSLLVLGLALVIASQYFSKIEKEEQPDFVQIFQVQSIFGNDIYKSILSIFNPEVKNFEPEMTIDETLLQNYQSQVFSLEEASVLNESQKKSLEQLEKDKYLQAGREQFSKLLGEDVQGTETIDSVLSEIVNKKINQIIAPSLLKENQGVVAGVLALLLFLTIWSLGSILAVFLVMLATLFFWILKKIKLVKIRKVMAEKEEVV